MVALVSTHHHDGGTTTPFYGTIPRVLPLQGTSVLTHHRPVDHVPESADVFRTAVLVLEVVGVFPHVEAEDGNHGLARCSLHERVVLRKRRNGETGGGEGGGGVSSFAYLTVGVIDH